MGLPRPVNAFGVEVDLEQKVLRTVFRGNVRGEDMKAPVAGLRDAFRKLGKGFVQVTDLTELEAMDLDSLPHLTKMMDASLAAGVSKIIRIIPDPEKDIGFTILSLTHYRGKVPIKTVKTRKDAEKEVGARK